MNGVSLLPLDQDLLLCLRKSLVVAGSFTVLNSPVLVQTQGKLPSLKAA